MRLVVQRVLESSVSVDGSVVGRIGRGYMVLCGVEDGDTEKDLAYCMDYMNIDENADFIDAFLRTALGTVAETCVIPMQDWLGLGKYTRMNTPSTSSGNWQWRLKKGEATEELAERMHELIKLYGRN